MHPALVILIVVLAVHVVNLIGRPNIEAALLPFYIRLFHAGQAKQQRTLKRDLYNTRQQLNLTSSQDEFAKWAKLRRTVDKIVTQLEAVNSQLAGASSSLSLLVRAVLFLSTTLFPFALTFYFGKTPMFFLPPSGSTATITHAARGLPVRRAPGGFELPYDTNHAWGMVNETYLGPLGWLLSMTAAPRGSVSAGMWSTICTRVLLVLTNQFKDVFIAIRRKKFDAVPMTDLPKSTVIPDSTQGVAESSSSLKKRTSAASKGKSEEL